MSTLREDLERLCAERGIEGLTAEASIAAFVAAVETTEWRLTGNHDSYMRASEIRSRAQHGRGDVTFDETVEVYRGAETLRDFGRHGKATGEPTGRDVAICLWLGLLKDSGLPVTSPRYDRNPCSPRTDLSSEERSPSLALAMHEATGIGESVIASAWRRRGLVDLHKLAR